MDRVAPLTEIGKIIKGLREERGKTQEEISAELEMPRGKYSKLEAGLQDLKTGDLIRISNYFNVSTDYILGRTETKTPDASVQAVCAYTGLSEKAVKILRNEDELTEHYKYKNKPNSYYLNAFIENISTMLLIENLNELREISSEYITNPINLVLDKEINYLICKKLNTNLDILEEIVFKNHLQDSRDFENAIRTQNQVNAARYKCIKEFEKIIDIGFYDRRALIEHLSKEEIKKFLEISDNDLIITKSGD